MLKKGLTYVTLTSRDKDKIISDLNLNVSNKNEDTIRFSNSISSDKLIKELSKYSIDRILIEEATLEDMFLHYYK